MRQPIIGFRSWYVAKPPEERVQHVAGTIVQGLAPNEWSTWLEARNTAPPPRARQRRPIEVGTLLPLSRAAAMVWSQPGTARFACKAGHEQPHRQCTCGLYAKFEDDGELTYGDAVGAIIAWGHVILHGAEGFRAEFARVVALSCSDRKQAKAVALARTAAERIGVPFVPRDQLVMVAREHGVLVKWRYSFE